ncbi:MAG: hypothetical protein LBF17_04795 [Mediterranea sp.]|nr:hypothetical protein [Mediterranea sp.]
MMSMAIQEWIVAIIVLFCVIEAGRRTVRFLRSAKGDDDPCANCVGGCDLKRLLDEKQQECKKNQKKGNKKCCG